MLKVINKRNKRNKDKYGSFTSWLYYGGDSSYINASSLLNKNLLNDLCNVIKKFESFDLLERLIFEINKDLYFDDKYNILKFVNNDDLKITLNRLIRELNAF